MEFNFQFNCSSRTS